MAESAGSSTTPINDSPDSKKQVKGILKHNHDQHPHPEVTFDEMNILETYHPANKDYGHMKIDEPPTPYNREFADDEPEEENTNQAVNPDDLAEKLKGASTKPDYKSEGSASEDDDSHLSEDAKTKKKEFRNKRKNHYNEFTNVRKARELIAKELAELEADEGQMDTSN